MINISIIQYHSLYNTYNCWRNEPDQLCQEKLTARMIPYKWYTGLLWYQQLSRSQVSPPQTSFPILLSMLASRWIDPAWIVVSIAAIVILIVIVMVVVIVLVSLRIISIHGGNRHCQASSQVIWTTMASWFASWFERQPWVLYEPLVDMSSTPVSSFQMCRFLF